MLLIGKLKMKKSDFEAMKKQLDDIDIKKRYRPNFIIGKLHKLVDLRRVFIAVIKFSPAFHSEIKKMTNLTKQNIYYQLYKLLSFGIIERIFIIDIDTHKPTADEEVYNKWKLLASQMPNDIKRQSLARGSVFRVTEYGKKFLKHAITFEEEFKIGKDERTEEDDRLEL